MPYHAQPRPLRECSLAICMEDMTPCRSSAQAGRGSKPLRMDVTIACSGLFQGHERQEGKDIPLDLTVANPRAPSNFTKKTKRSRSAITMVVKRQSSKYRSTFPATYTLFPRAVSMCETLGSDTQALIKGMVISCFDMECMYPPARRARRQKVGKRYFYYYYYYY